MTLSGVISYPIPIYSNPQITPQYYQPSRFNISAITTGQTTTVTTSVDNNFVVGQEVRLLVPPIFGSYQLNNVSGFAIDPPNKLQPLTSETAADGTSSYSLDLLATLRISFPNVVLVPGVTFYFNYGIANQTIYQDDGMGNMNRISGPYTISAGTVSYSTGIVSFTFTSAPPNATAAKASFWYNEGVYANKVYLNIDSSKVDAFIASPYNATITNITTTNPVTVTATNSFHTGQGALFSNVGGMTQINGRAGHILTRTSSTLTINIDGTGFSAYTSGGTLSLNNVPQTIAQIIAIGDINSGVTNSNGKTSDGTFIPGSFINISPL